jgi:hypothetical protein
MPYNSEGVPCMLILAGRPVARHDCHRLSGLRNKGDGSRGMETYSYIAFSVHPMAHWEGGTRLDFRNIKRLTFQVSSWCTYWHRSHIWMFDGNVTFAAG